jgi:hypothetical protein
MAVFSAKEKLFICNIHFPFFCSLFAGFLLTARVDFGKLHLVSVELE